MWRRASAPVTNRPLSLTPHLVDLVHGHLALAQATMSSSKLTLSSPGHKTWTLPSDPSTPAISMCTHACYSAMQSLLYNQNHRRLQMVPTAHPPLSNFVKLRIHTVRLRIHIIKMIIHTFKLIIHTIKLINHTIKLRIHTLLPTNQHPSMLNFSASPSSK